MLRTANPKTGTSKVHDIGLGFRGLGFRGLGFSVVT